MRMAITFIAAVYNEANEIDDFIRHVEPHVDAIRICDDESVDVTPYALESWRVHLVNFEYKVIPHTGLPETVKNEALKMVPDWTDWVLMLDADERLTDDTWKSIKEWTDWTNSTQQDFDFVYFRQVEIIDGRPVREFQKCKLFRPSKIHFPLDNIHADDQFDGNGTYYNHWIVEHRKSSTKQIIRETEYLATYKRLLEEGKIDEGRYQWLVNLHHFVKPHG